MKFDVNYEQSQFDGASLHNVESDLDTHNEEKLVVSYFSHCGALEYCVTSQLEDESRDIGIRSAEVIDIDCLTPEIISSEQDNDSVIGLVKNWKVQNQKPTCEMIASAVVELKAYWRQWESLYLVNNVL